MSRQQDSRQSFEGESTRGSSLVQSFTFESLLARLSAGFINLPPERIDQEIEHWFARIADLLELDGCVVFQQSQSGGPLGPTHSLLRPPIRPFPDSSLAGSYPWLSRRLLSSEIVSFASREEIPRLARHDQFAAADQGIEALAAIPIPGPEEDLVGGILFVAASAREKWSEETIQRLWLVAQVFRNALARKRGELKLIKSEQRLRTVANHTTDFIYDVDTRKGTIEWHSDVDGPLGYQPGEFPRTIEGWAETIHPDDRKMTLGSAADGQEEVDFIYRVRCKDGSYRVWKTSGSVVEWEEGVPVRWIGANTDITEQAEAEAEADELRSQLFHVSRVSMMGELAASLAHEINQPLAAIMSNAQAIQRLLREQPPDLHEVSEALEDIVQDDKRASKVISGLRALVRRDTLRVREAAELDINLLIREIVDLLRGDLQGRRIGIELDLEEALPGIRGDRIHLQQLVLNLLVNARESTEEAELPPGDAKHSIAIGTRGHKATGIEITVTDSGIGIAPDALPRLFEPFFTTRDTGMGMGLSICRSIAEAHGGTIRAGSAPAGGAIFRVILPGGTG